MTSPPDVRRGRALALLCAIYFIVILDAAIVRLAIPAIHRELGLSAASEQWVANAYMLTFGTLLLLGQQQIRLGPQSIGMLRPEDLFPVANYLLLKVSSFG